MNQKPLNSGCKHKNILWTSVVLLVLASTVLYWLQHSELLAGGAIAPPKLAWLITVIVYWYILPIYWFIQPDISRKLKLIYGLFLISMLLRAVIELSMMYITSNWLHIYGIGHDIFSVCLCALFSIISLAPTHSNSQNNRKSVLFFLFCSGLFVLETVFAYYLKSVSNADGSVFFLESTDEHSTMLWITRIAVLVSIIMFGYLTRSTARATA